MPSRRGEFLLNVEPGGDAPLTDEQQVFIGCVEDVLVSTPGLVYALVRDRREMDSRDRTAYATFLVRTKPAHGMALAIELTERAFVVRLNGLSFARRRGVATRFETWVQRRCRDLERMVGGELRLIQHTLLTVPVSSTLEAGGNGRWRRIATVENGWVAILSFLVPYGFLLSGRKVRVFDDWFS